MSQIDFTKMAHDQLDEWIQGKFGNERFYGNHILDLGKLARTMEYAREQYRQEHMSKLYFGSKVQHNFSKQRGVVIDFRNDPQGYKWKVCFEGHLGDTLGKYTDWFKEEVLLEGWDNE